MIEPRTHLQKIYRDVERSGKRMAYTRLDRNERVSPLPEAVRQDVLSGLPPDVFNAYPDSAPLYERLSRRLGIDEDELFVTSGSDTAIRRIFETFVGPGDAVIHAEPTYAMYAVYSQLYQASAVMIPYDVERRLPVGRILERLDKKARLLLIANPDQPTGTVLPSSVLREIAGKAQATDTLFVIDEAYYPFHQETALAWRQEFGNVIVTRTFSKVGGLAGLRLGYLVGPRRLVGFIQRTRGSYDVNAMAVAVGCYLLDHPELERAHLEQVEAGREVLCQAAKRLNLGFPQCATNFQLLRFAAGTDLKAIVEGLKAEGFLIKGPFGTPALRNCLRVTLAEPMILRTFVAALEKVLAQQGSVVG